MHPFKLRFWSSCLGNLFEHYDTALFGFLSPFLAPLIFPKHDPMTALILTFAMIPLGMVARPLGSLFFGYIGDWYGRQKALFWTLGGMSIVSFGIAFIPTHAQVGALAPALFCMARVLQNFLAAGETMGGAIFLLEGVSKERQDFFSSLYNASTIAGILLASAAVSLLYYVDATSSGWRVLYLIGSMTAFFGFLIRRQDSEPVVSSPRTPLWKTFVLYRRPLFLIMIASGFAYANYAMALVLMNGFIPLISSYTKAEMMGLNTLLLVLDFCTLPLFGYLSSKFSRHKLMIASALAVALTSAPLLMLIKGASFATLVGIRTAFVLFGVAFFAPFHAWAKNLLPAHSRYAVISLGYALGSQLFGGPTASLSLWLFQKTGTTAACAVYWVVLGLAAAFAVAKTVKEPAPEEVA